MDWSIPSPKRRTLRDLPRLDAVPAVRHEQVYAVDGSSYFNRPGPRLVTGIEILAEIFHPEAFGGISPEHAMQPVQLLPLAAPSQMTGRRAPSLLVCW